MALDTYRSEVTTKLAALMSQLPKDMGVTDDGCDRFQLEHMVDEAAKSPSLPELQSAINDIIGYVECLIFLPRPAETYNPTKPMKPFSLQKST